MWPKNSLRQLCPPPFCNLAFALAFLNHSCVSLTLRTGSLLKSFFLTVIPFQESVKQRTIGKTRDGANFPVATKLQVERGLLDIQIWVSILHNFSIFSLFCNFKVFWWWRLFYVNGILKEISDSLPDPFPIFRQLLKFIWFFVEIKTFLGYSLHRVKDN